MGRADLLSKLRWIFERQGAQARLSASPDLRPEDYDGVFEKAVGRIRPEAAKLEAARTAVERHYQDFENLPAERRKTVLRDGSPQLLVTLARDLIRRSWAARFDDVRRSLRLATHAVEVVERIGLLDYLSPCVFADLEAEALGYLGNAQRIASRLPRAEETFERAERRREAGTGDRALHALLLGLRAAFLNARGEAEDAAVLQDRQIALRRLLGDPAELASALISRGLTACWDEGPTRRASALMREGTELAEDHRLMLIAALGLGEAFARAGQGAEALVLLETAHPLVAFVESFENSHAWVQALAFRALGEHDRAARQLREVRVDLEEQGRARRAAVAATDLMAVYAEQGRYREAHELAAEAWLTFRQEGLGGAGVAALLSLSKALHEQTATGATAVAIANYVARCQHNRHARLEVPDE